MVVKFINHFQQLINSSFLLLKFDYPISTSNDDLYKQLLLNNKHQIYSFYLTFSLKINHFFSLLSIDSSFDHLESLIIIGIPKYILLPLLINLSSLPRFVSLTIDAERTLYDFSDVYRLAFALPKLKYMKCLAEVYGICNYKFENFIIRMFT